VWLPAYCAQVVGRDPLGQVRYQLLDAGQGDVILQQLEPVSAAAPSAHPRAGGTLSPGA
jgi:hypothetical protein